MRLDTTAKTDNQNVHRSSPAPVGQNIEFFEQDPEDVADWEPPGLPEDPPCRYPRRQRHPPDYYEPSW